MNSPMALKKFQNVLSVNAVSPTFKVQPALYFRCSRFVRKRNIPRKNRFASELIVILQIKNGIALKQSPILGCCKIVLAPCHEFQVFKSSYFCYCLFEDFISAAFL